MHGQTFGTIRTPQANTLSYEEFLERLNAKDRVNVEKHLALCDASSNPRHAQVWRQLACYLMALSGHSAKINRQPPSAQFFTTDGKYRMQVFAIEDDQLGELRVYCSDTLDHAVKTGVLFLQNGEEAGGYRVAGSGDPLAIERLDGATVNPAACFKDMVGWNRKALRISLPTTASDSQIRAVHALCSLAVQGLYVPRPAQLAIV